MRSSSAQSRLPGLWLASPQRLAGLLGSDPVPVGTVRNNLAALAKAKVIVWLRDAELIWMPCCLDPRLPIGAKGLPAARAALAELRARHFSMRRRPAVQHEIVSVLRAYERLLGVERQNTASEKLEKGERSEEVIRKQAPPPLQHTVTRVALTGAAAAGPTELQTETPEADSTAPPPHQEELMLTTPLGLPEVVPASEAPPSAPLEAPPPAPEPAAMVPVEPAAPATSRRPPADLPAYGSAEFKALPSDWPDRWRQAFAGEPPSRDAPPYVGDEPLGHHVWTVRQFVVATQGFCPWHNGLYSPKQLAAVRQLLAHPLSLDTLRHTCGATMGQVRDDKPAHVGLVISYLRARRQRNTARCGRLPWGSAQGIYAPVYVWQCAVAEHAEAPKVKASLTSAGERADADYRRKVEEWASRVVDAK